MYTKLLIFLLALYAGAAAFSQTPDKRLKQIQSQVIEKQRYLSSSSDEVERLQRRLEHSARNFNKIHRSLKESAENLATLEAQLAILDEQADELSKQHATQLSLLAASLRSMQRDARARQLDYLLNADDWHQLTQRTVYYDYFSRARTQQLAKLSTQLSNLHDTRKALEEHRHLLEVERKRQQKLARQLAIERQHKQQAIDDLEREIEKTHIALSELQQNAAELRKLISQLSVLATMSKQFSTLKGKLPWPLDAPIKTRIGYGKLPGAFLKANVRSSVKSIHDGSVVFSDWFRGYGMLMIIDHGDGYLSLYANNEALYKEVGNTVRSGEPIAEVGTGGVSNETGLYFEIRKLNKQLDPQLWCHR